MNIKIIDYGAGNVRSVKFALERLGINAECTNNVEEILAADKLIFPGVGEAKSAMEELRKQKLDTLIPQLVQPVFGICLGMQLLCKHSEEGDSKGLGVFDLNVKKFENSVKVPHIGWNTIYNLNSAEKSGVTLFDGLKENSFVYFVHSYYVPKSNYTIATCDYQVEYSAAIQKDNFVACQFHPEKSGSIGERILENFLKF